MGFETVKPWVSHYPVLRKIKVKAGKYLSSSCHRILFKSILIQFLVTMKLSLILGLFPK